MRQKMKRLPKPKNHLGPPRKLVAYGRLVQP